MSEMAHQLVDRGIPVGEPNFVHPDGGPVALLLRYLKTLDGRSNVIRQILQRHELSLRVHHLTRVYKRNPRDLPKNFICFDLGASRTRSLGLGDLRSNARFRQELCALFAGGPWGRSSSDGRLRGRSDR